MREVLFRGQRIRQKLADKGEWVYGAFIPDPKEALEGRVRGVGFIWQWDPETGRKKVFTVSRETVGQWTGLTDCKGVRIFEGDLISCAEWARDAAFGPPVPAQVIYNAEHAAFEYAWPDCPNIAPHSLAGAEWTVAGNVHDLRKEAGT